MNQHQPPSDQDLDDIEARAAALYEYATVTDPEGQAALEELTDKDVPVLVDEVRRLRATFTDLAVRWEQLAEQGDTAIGQFEGPAAATLDAEVAERGNTYRQAAADARSVLAGGSVPDDLLTSDERRAAVSSGS